MFYEVGLAHALQKPTVLLTQSLGKVPFDLQSYNVTRYTRDFAEVERLRDSLVEVARRLKDASIVFGNPVSDFAPEVAITIPEASIKE